MPQPTPRDVHVDAALTNISVAYMQDQTNFIADKVFPIVPVEKQSDVYFKYDKGAFFKDEAQVRAAASESAGSGFDLSTDSYYCPKWAIHKDVDEDTVANADPAVDPFRDATTFVTQQLLIRRERLFAANYLVTGKWGTDVTGGTNFAQWDDEASSDPFEDLKVARIKILSTTGHLPNVFVVSYEVHEALKKHPLVMDRFKYTSSDSITEAMLARLFEVDRYVVAKSIYQTSKEKATTGTYAFIASKCALLVYAAPSPSLLQPTGGYIFAWRGLTGLNGAGIRTKRFRMEHLGADRVETEMAMVMKLIASDMGYFFATAVA
jgi:hypothetical protein